MKRRGKGTRANERANRQSAAAVVSEFLEFCWLCGSTFNLQRSHSDKRRLKPELTHVAILDGECHAFIEYRLDADTRRAVNDRLIEMRMDDGRYRFEKVLELMPADRATELVNLLARRQKAA